MSQQPPPPPPPPSSTGPTRAPVPAYDPNKPIQDFLAFERKIVSSLAETNAAIATNQGRLGEEFSELEVQQTRKNLAWLEYARDGFLEDLEVVRAGLRRLTGTNAAVEEEAEAATQEPDARLEMRVTNEIMRAVNRLDSIRVGTERLESSRTHSNLDVTIRQVDTDAGAPRWRALVSPRTNPTEGMARYRGVEMSGRIAALESLRDEVLNRYFEQLQRRFAREAEDEGAA